jgi:uracil phosphoribosyltransferase
MVTILNKTNSIINNFIFDLRDKNKHTDRARFRLNLERLGQIMAYEISRKLEYQEEEVTTPLGKTSEQTLKSELVIATILRAGLPFHQGLLSYFDNAENAFISAYRYHHSDHDFEVKVEYMSCPDISGKTLIICDTMLATGTSLVLSYKALLSRGKPARVIVCGVIASEQGVEYIKKNIPRCDIYLAAVDKELTAKAFIVPGLGDAGDLAFGPKI